MSSGTLRNYLMYDRKNAPPYGLWYDPNRQVVWKIFKDPTSSKLALYYVDGVDSAKFERNKSTYKTDSVNTASKQRQKRWTICTSASEHPGIAGDILKWYKETAKNRFAPGCSPDELTGQSSSSRAAAGIPRRQSSGREAHETTTPGASMALVRQPSASAPAAAQSPTAPDYHFIGGSSHFLEPHHPWASQMGFEHGVYYHTLGNLQALWHNYQGRWYYKIAGNNAQNPWYMGDEDVPPEIARDESRRSQPPQSPSTESSEDSDSNALVQMLHDMHLVPRRHGSQELSHSAREGLTLDDLEAEFEKAHQQAVATNQQVTVVDVDDAVEKLSSFEGCRSLPFCPRFLPLGQDRNHFQIAADLCNRIASRYGVRQRHTSPDAYHVVLQNVTERGGATAWISPDTRRRAPYFRVLRPPLEWSVAMNLDEIWRHGSAFDPGIMPIGHHREYFNHEETTWYTAEYLSRMSERGAQKLSPGEVVTWTNVFCCGTGHPDLKNINDWCAQRGWSRPIEPNELAQKLAEDAAHASWYHQSRQPILHTSLPWHIPQVHPH